MNPVDEPRVINWGYKLYHNLDQNGQSLYEATCDLESYLMARAEWENSVVEFAFVCHPKLYSVFMEGARLVPRGVDIADRLIINGRIIHTILDDNVEIKAMKGQRLYPSTTLYILAWRVNGVPTLRPIPPYDVGNYAYMTPHLAGKIENICFEDKELEAKAMVARLEEILREHRHKR